eukprot:CAMPEP_0177680664 /NCGR_PEP_ID=MMETSP0447-20121125/30295_1 /TAXON_ID=0 /ORGANISM="Stygamoeba regulata, Strain BSH-02190019" /LENGTH=423 /DNA_ID=CAMNT_0019190013 /DNA_START=237 /DNA_END=1508 /DNA_ORIENTATION=-
MPNRPRVGPSSWQEFTKLEFPNVVGRNVPQYLDISREVRNEGFHRDVSYSLNGRYEQVRSALVLSGTSYSDAVKVKHYRCGAIFFESFSESVYLDRYQLEDLYQRGQGPFVFHSRKLDLEVAANHVAAQSSVAAVVLLSPVLTYPHAPSWNVTVPIHLRYQPPSHKFTHFHLWLKTPYVFWTCFSETPLIQTAEELFRFSGNGSFTGTFAEPVFTWEFNNTDEESDSSLTPQPVWTRVIEEFEAISPKATSVPTGQLRDLDMITKATSYMIVLATLMLVFVSATRGRFRTPGWQATFNFVPAPTRSDKDHDYADHDSKSHHEDSDSNSELGEESEHTSCDDLPDDFVLLSDEDDEIRDEDRDEDRDDDEQDDPSDSDDDDDDDDEDDDDDDDDEDDLGLISSDESDHSQRAFSDEDLSGEEEY